MSIQTALSLSDQSFPVAVEGPVKLGYKGEISQMLIEDMTLIEGIRYSRKNWSVHTVVPNRHDAMHLKLGMALILYPKRDFLKHYQGTYEAEIYADAMENLVMYYDPPDRYFTLENFISQINSFTRKHLKKENERRVIMWLLGKELGMSHDDITEAYGWEFYEITKIAEHHGIRNRYIAHRPHEIISPNNPDFVVSEESEKNILPEGSNGFDVFEAYTGPTDEQIKQVYTAVAPAISMLKNVPEDYSMFDIKIRDLMAAIWNSPSNVMGYNVQTDRECVCAK
ncbi:MAG: hypothetical protein R3E13_06445 [Alphaproteobacteria bacterium]